MGILVSVLQRNRTSRIYFKTFAYTVVGVGKSEICRVDQENENFQARARLHSFYKKIFY